MSLDLAIDIGGTFIDAVLLDRDAGTLSQGKVATDPDDLTGGILEALDRLGADPAQISTFVHGTTLGLNAVVERDGATTGLVTNEGFEDVLEIGRETVPDDHRYDMGYRRPDPLVPRRRRVGVPGRIDADGAVEVPLDEAAVRDAATHLVEDHDVEALAISFLHAYRNPRHEERARAVVREAYPDLSVSISSDTVSEYGEFERTSTTAIEAYIKPIFESYVEDLVGSLEGDGFDGRLFITRSGGGAFPARKATDTPVHTIFSGPAGGLIGCESLAESLDLSQYITLDMGGTTTDACVAHGGSPELSYESTVETHPVLIPRFDIRSIGAGGGSIAWPDRGLLRVGPRSAGAYPGPVCYGRGGDDPTVTDAGAVIGYLNPESFLRGELALDIPRARRAIRERLADPLGMSVEEAASGVFRVATANITNAVKELTVERGKDPRRFSVVAYGGAGPMVVPMVARALDVGETVVPKHPAVFSSWGMLRTDVVYDASQTRIELVDDVEKAAIDGVFEELLDELRTELEGEGFDADARRFRRSIEMRYFGQEHTVEVPLDDHYTLADLTRDFEAEYRARYNHVQDGPVEVVTLRVRGVGASDHDERTARETAGAGDATAAPATSRESYCVAADAPVEFDVYARDALPPSTRVGGPAIIQEPTSTIVVHSDQRARVDDAGHVRITQEA